MASAIFLAAALTGQTTDSDLAAYVAQTNDYNAAFQRGKGSPSTARYSTPRSGYRLQTTGSAPQDAFYLAKTKPNYPEGDVSVDMYFAGAPSGQEIFGLSSCNDNGPKNNELNAFFIYRPDGSVSFYSEVYISGNKYSAFSNDGTAVAVTAGNTYTLNLSFRKDGNSNLTVTATFGPKGGAATSTFGPVQQGYSSFLNNYVGVRFTPYDNIPKSDTSGVFMSNFKASVYAASGTVTPPANSTSSGSTTALAAGAITSVAAGASAGSATVTAAAPTGGTSPYSVQFQRAPDIAGAPGSYANVGTAGTSTTLADSGLTAGATYWYREVVTDSAGTPATATGAAKSYTVPSPGFSLSTAPASLDLLQGQALTLTVTGVASGGYSGTDALSCIGLPQGVSASFSPASLTNGAGSSTLTLTAAGNALTGVSTIGVQASDGTLTVSTPVMLQVEPPSGVVYPAVSNILDTDLVTITRNGSTEEAQASVLKSYLAGGG